MHTTESHHDKDAFGPMQTALLSIQVYPSLISLYIFLRLSRSFYYSHTHWRYFSHNTAQIICNHYMRKTDNTAQSDQSLNYSQYNTGILNKYSNILTPVLLNPDIPFLCKQCSSKSVGFWRFRSQLIWICTVCHEVCEFISTIWVK